MVDTNDLVLLLDLEEKVANQYGVSVYVDIKPLAKEIGLNIEAVMSRIVNICETKKYNVGSHMDCTKRNVIPEYKRDGELRLNSDHIEGLRKILAVDMGIMLDYK